MKKRKLVQLDVIKSFKIQKGAAFQPEFSKRQADLTAEMIKDGSWQKVSFKEINLTANGKQL